MTRPSSSRKTASRTKPSASSRAKPAPRRRAAPKRKRPTMAERADRHALYQDSVQCPEFDVRFFAKTYRAIRGRPARTMREDFCGTGMLSLTWVKGDPKRRAIGVDFDLPTLEYGREHVLGAAPESQRRRVRLVHANVLDRVPSKADVTCAMNFSYCVFKTRSELKRYFRRAHQGLGRDGILVTEIYGGTETIRPLVERRKVGRVTYVWHQESFNPITSETLCHIHFTFPDGSRLRRAFTYDWRLWTIPEIRECMLEAGFERVVVYWEGTDDKGQPNGRYRPETVVENDRAWISYVVGIK